MKKMFETAILVALVAIMSLFVATDQIKNGGHSGEVFTTGIVVHKVLDGRLGKYSLVVNCMDGNYEVLADADLYYKVSKGDRVGVKVIGGIPAYAIHYRRVKNE